MEWGHLPLGSALSPEGRVILRERRGQRCGLGFLCQAAPTMFDQQQIREGWASVPKDKKSFSGRSGWGGAEPVSPSQGHTVSGVMTVIALLFPT